MLKQDVGLFIVFGWHWETNLGVWKEKPSPKMKMRKITKMSEWSHVVGVKNGVIHDDSFKSKLLYVTYLMIFFYFYDPRW